MASLNFRSLLQLRTWLAAPVLALWLVACGGGGGGDGTDVRFVQPATPVLEGMWELAVQVDGVSFPLVPLAGSEVLTAPHLTQLTAATLARQLALAFRAQGYDVAVSGSSLIVTDPDTNYVLTINSFLPVSDFLGCGACQVGSIVSFSVLVNLTESGTLDGRRVLPVSFDAVLRFTYVRRA